MPDVLSTTSLTDDAVMLMAVQRTAHLSPRARRAWEAGDEAPLRTEVKARRPAIVSGVIAEITKEYQPLLRLLAQDAPPRHLVDIGCGQGFSAAMIARDFGPRITLVDIEETPERHHGWADAGSGYASLAAAQALVVENAPAGTLVEAVNPRTDPSPLNSLVPDLVTSFLSCGFHYPVDEYLPLLCGTLDRGGTVCLDLRLRYLREHSKGLQELMSNTSQKILFETGKAKRMFLRRAP